MKKTNHLLFWLCLCFMIPFFGISQNTEIGYYNWFDAQVGVENSGLFNGKEYIDLDRATTENYKFFKTPRFVTGSVTYSGQHYYNVDIKYNVWDDLLVIKLPNDGSEVILTPVKAYTTNFTIGDHHFVHVNDSVVKATNKNGFYELLQDNTYYTFYKKYQKGRSNKVEGDRSYYVYKDSRPIFFLKYNGQFTQVSSKRDLIKIFPQYKKEINSVRERTGKNDPNANETYLKNLLTKVKGLLSNETNTK